MQRSSQVSNKKDAQVVESAFRTQLALGKIGIKPKKDVPTFEQAANDFLEWLKIEHQSSTTYDRYHFACLPLKSFFSKKKIDTIDNEVAEKYIVWRCGQTSRKTGKPLDNATINRELLTLKKIFRRQFDAGTLPRNPMDAVKRLPESDPPFYVLSAKEEKLYLFACSPLLKDVAVMMLETGARPSEVAAIQRTDVFLSQNYFQIRKGKTKAARRKVFLTNDAKNVLSARLKRFKGYYLFPFGDVDGSLSTTTDALDKLHLKAINDLSFVFRLYDCRHTAATRFLEKGKVDLVTLAAILGHNSLRMVMRYAHPSEEHKADAIKRMEKTKRAKAV